MNRVHHSARTFPDTFLALPAATPAPNLTRLIRKPSFRSRTSMRPCGTSMNGVGVRFDMNCSFHFVDQIVLRSPRGLNAGGLPMRGAFGGRRRPIGRSRLLGSSGLPGAIAIHGTGTRIRLASRSAHAAV
jgi:hypothetical protein